MTLVKKLVKKYLLWSVREAKADRYVCIYQNTYKTIHKIAKALNLTSELVLTYITEESIQKNAKDLRDVYAACRQAVLNAPEDQYGILAMLDASWTFGWERAKRDLEELSKEEQSEGIAPPSLN